jgi:predicted nucleic acid-binding protein/GNAT superfamily N-acetyltransferase
LLIEKVKKENTFDFYFSGKLVDVLQFVCRFVGKERTVLTNANKIFVVQIEKINNIDSIAFSNAVKLGDENTKTLGFLPRVAFEKYAKQNQLIGAFDKTNSDLLGYLLYRISYDKVTIVHLCIDGRHRNKGVAKKLVDYLKRSTKEYQGIKLSCRNDYGINAVWEQFNFVPIREKSGRSKAGHPLTIWWFSHQKKNLFSHFEEYERKNKIGVVIDANIFLDIKNGRNTESESLMSDWLQDEINLYLTREILNEINRNSNNTVKESSRRFALFFKELPFYENEYSTVYNELLQTINPETENDISDIKHIAYAITGGGDYFITRDEFLLKNKEKFTTHGVEILRPSHFIAHLDETRNTIKYKPRKLIGANISSNNVNASNVEYIISRFLEPQERKAVFSEKIRTFISLPQKYELVTVTKENEFIALVVYDRSENNTLGIPLFRVLKNRLKETLTKHLLFKIIQIATSEDRRYIDFTDNALDIVTDEIIGETRFIRIDEIWRKINLTGTLPQKVVLEQLADFGDVEIIERINCFEPSNSVLNDNTINYSIERYLFPLKITDLILSNFIIPIKSYWAEELFDDKSEQKLAFFEPNYHLLLNRENVYYRSATPKILKSQSRILWYVSENKQSGQKGHIRACSYIDAIFVDDPKKLYKQFKQLGIYSWPQISQTANGKDKIMAFIFSDTELFERNIPISFLRSIFETMENKKFMVVSPIEIKNETYMEIYKKGMNL